MVPDPIKQLESYELTARPMGMQDIPALHALSIGVQWPHRPEDWAMLIQLGQGVVAEDAIGRVVGSAMWWPMGPASRHDRHGNHHATVAGAWRGALADAPDRRGDRRPRQGAPRDPRGLAALPLARLQAGADRPPASGDRGGRARRRGRGRGR